MALTDAITNLPQFQQAASVVQGIGRIFGKTDASNEAATSEGYRRLVDGRPVELPQGAQAVQNTPVDVKFTNIRNEQINLDTRVKIRVPESYINQLTGGLKSEIFDLGGIIFPYTPQISLEHRAEYSTLQPMHSNYTQYFYQRSSVSPIQITGKFTVQNEKDAGVYLATVHLLRALTKMRSGGADGDGALSGNPPPVCRLDAYGSFMLDNVPVVVNSFRQELPEGVDYYTLGKTGVGGGYINYDLTSVPTYSTITVSLYPMYSRAETQKFNVNGWLTNKDVRRSGFL
jgi:hypothetical protein